jgi:hypothetical protein
MKTYILSAALAFSFPHMASASTTIGGTDSNNCLPFSCSNLLNLTSYQQIYSATAFSGLININKFSIFARPEFGNTVESATFDISFYTTSKAVNGLSSTGADNLGTLLTNFGIFTLGGITPSQLDFNGPTFTYDPSAGNLLLVVNLVSNQASGFGAAFFSGFDPATSRYIAFGGSPTGFLDTSGLQTRFDFAAAAVPEPANWALMILGFGAIGSMMRRRKPKVTFSYA